jgi:hypothetical protein
MLWLPVSVAVNESSIGWHNKIPTIVLSSVVLCRSHIEISGNDYTLISKFATQ